MGSSIKDTIAAISTPIGKGGIGIIRISGDEAWKIAERIFLPKHPIADFQPHHLYLGNVLDPESRSIIDEVLISYMKAPHSYTKEDVVEINSHSGHLVLSKILELILRQGARIAEPGEFTYRAFMNGRIDLTQAEAILDLINAKSEKGLHLASQHLKGEFGRSISSIKESLLNILAHIEAGIDFPEDEPEVMPREEIADVIERKIMKEIENLIGAYINRRIWLEGVDTVIVGAVNVGKSSLLNILSQEQKAIVTPLPGTTRDIIETTIYINGIPLSVKDTAGFRKAKDQVEEIGLRLAKKKMAEAQLLLIVLDQSRDIDEFDIQLLSSAPKGKSVIVINKVDLPTVMDLREISNFLKSHPYVKISALKGTGIEELKWVISELILRGDDEESSGFALNLRQKNLLLEAKKALEASIETLRADQPPEIVAMEINEAINSISRITGEVVEEDLYERIFSNFCIGK
ncbi:MAG TPA: tRNA uridine-5-carboxymethylaminomethyl(34) synthesis GTPase MnmE [Desulfobacteraceae bacterium]|nr:tRNA uridine-5-carboxymethylaminomethyl(34) synthesis GTPase MnmE [Desulfobacteraceae bacterium]